MLEIRNVPVVVELGVQALEVEMRVGDKKVGERCVWFTFNRVEPDTKMAEHLPFVTTSLHPNVFSLHPDPRKSPFILLYDALGRLTIIYVRDNVHEDCWDRREVPPENRGQAVTCFSVRYAFSSSKDRNKFMSLIGQLVKQHQSGQPIDKTMAEDAIAILAKSRLAPVSLPLAKTRTEVFSARA